MNTEQTRDKRWRSRLYEFITIVLGILGAFAIDAAWEQRGERAQEQALTAALVADFAGARADLDRVMAVHDSVLWGADRLMALSNREDLSDADPAMLGAALVWTLANPTFDPPTGTVETILSSGRVDILRNDELVKELTRWSAAVQDMREDELVANEHLYRSLFPIYAEELNLRDMVRTGPYVWPGAKRDVNDFFFLLDNEPQSALWWLYGLHTNVAQRSGPDVAAAIDRIMGLLNEP
jgi:hypothetical protein